VRLTPARLALALLLVVPSCTRSAANHEELGDRAYAAGSYADALAEYQLGRRTDPGNATLLAKVGATALHAEDYELAAEAYRALGRRDRSRAEEAADGLDRVARAALGANDRTALASALTGLREVAPRRPLGRYVVLAALDAVDRGDTAEAAALLPVAAASAPDAARADSLLFVYGRALVRVRDCSTAVRVFEGVIRRQRAPAVVESAREGLGLCALVAGQIALEQGRPSDAEGWFRRATAPGASQDVTRAAFLGLGDVRMAQGDVTGAMESYQQALAGGTPGDTISQKAQERLNALGKAEPE
jgi:tetratricopeptide (TPR) repeat protein